MQRYIAILLIFFTSGITGFSSPPTHIPLYSESHGSGQNIIAVHGGPGMDSGYLKPYLFPLSTFSRIILYDQRGCGKSPAAQDFHATIDGAVTDLEILREKLNIRSIILLAHSFGSVIALKFAVKFPENVKALIIVSGYARKHPDQYKYFFVPDLLKQQIQDIQNSNLTESVKQKKITALRFSLYFYQKKYRSKKFLEKFTQSSGFNRKIFQELSVSEEYLGFDERIHLRALTIPFLILCGKHDIVTPLFLSEELKNTVRRGKLVVFENSGHFPFIEENVKFIATVKNYFVQELQ